MFDTRTLVAVVSQLKRPKTFFLDTFFKKSKVSQTKYVDIDVIKGKRRLAPFVSPKMQGKLVEKIGYETKTYEPAYVKPKFVLEPEDFEARDVGQTIYENNETPASRAQKKLGELLADGNDQITRREEWMAAQALLTGVVPVVGDGVNMSIDFHLEATHEIVLVGDDLWTNTLSTPLDDLEDWGEIIIQDSGLVCDIIVMGKDAARAFVNHADVQKKLDNRRIIMGEINPAAIANGARYLGHVNQLGCDIYTYHEWFVEESTGLEGALMDPKKVLLGSTRAECIRHYGAIKDLKAMAAMERFPKVWENEDPSCRFLMLQSAPLPAPHQIDAFVVAQVIA
jgi:hypothetical protein